MLASTPSPHSSAEALTITRWPSKTSTIGTETQLSWPALGDFLSTPCDGPLDAERPDLPGWSPAAFEGGRRRKGLVRVVSALGLDVDTGELELADLREAFDGVRAFVHNTKSAKSSAQTWRIVVAVSRPMTPTEHAIVLAHERDRLALLGVELDEKTKDCSRLWFVPCLPLATEFLFASLEGEPLDVDAILESASLFEPPPRSSASTARAYEPESIGESTKKRRASAWLEHAEVAISGQRGHDVAMRVATAVVRGFGLEKSAALEVLARWNERCRPPWSMAELARKVDEAARVGAMPWGAKLEERRPTQLRALPSPDEHGPIIRQDVNLERDVDAAVDALTADETLFQRNGALVHVVRVPETEADASTLAGTPQIRPLAVPTLREKLASAARWQKFDGRSKGWKPCLPSNDVVAAVSARGQWKGVRPIVGVIESPSLRPDGTVIQREGYDPVTGFLLLGASGFPPIPETPTHDDAKRALAELAEPLAEFPFANEAHRSATLAAVLTIVARPAIEGAVPGFLFDASTRGSGKTLQADVVSLIATGREASKASFPVDDEELEKVLGAYAVRGASVIAFDNIARPFGGAPIDKCLTAGDAVEFRVLGKSEVPSLRWRAVLLGTGNNISLVGDTARRVLFSRLEPREEAPEDRTNFAISDLRAWVRANRARLVAAALTLLRAFVVAGRPSVGVATWGSFEAWSRLVPAALVWGGAADPMKARPSGDPANEPEKAALATLLAGWSRLAASIGADGMTAKVAVQALYPPGRPASAPPDGFDDMREAAELLTGAHYGKPPSAAKLGGALRLARRRNIGGRCFDSKTVHGGVQRWFVVDMHRPAPTSTDPPSGGDGGAGGPVPTPRVGNGGEEILQGHGGKLPNQPHHPHHEDEVESEDDYDWTGGLLT